MISMVAAIVAERAVNSGFRAGGLGESARVGPTDNTAYVDPRRKEATLGRLGALSRYDLRPREVVKTWKKLLHPFDFE